MSRGFGKWQLAILAQLASQEIFWLRSLLDYACTKAEYNALLRAALKLEDAGLIRIDRWQYGSNDGAGRTAVMRIGTESRSRSAVPRSTKCWSTAKQAGGRYLNVGQVPNGDLATT
jgi:hypothetical protein